MTSILDAELTQDAFLGGRVQAWQPKAGYRAGVDPVLLAAACPAQAGETVLELGCGVGVASLCLAWRTGAQVTGLEMQPRYAQLARRNGLDVVDGDLREMPAALRAQSFDHVIANPPYFDRGAGTRAKDAGREAALGEAAALSDWTDAALKRLKPRGWITLIHRAERLPELLLALGVRVGDLKVLPVAPRAQRASELVLLRARKGARAPFTLLPPFVMHEGAHHVRDGDDYSPKATSVLRQGASLEDHFCGHR